MGFPYIIEVIRIFEIWAYIASLVPNLKKPACTNQFFQQHFYYAAYTITENECGPLTN